MKFHVIVAGLLAVTSMTARAAAKCEFEGLQPSYSSNYKASAAKKDGKVIVTIRGLENGAVAENRQIRFGRTVYGKPTSIASSDMVRTGMPISTFIKPLKGQILELTAEFAEKDCKFSPNHPEVFTCRAENAFDDGSLVDAKISGNENPVRVRIVSIQSALEKIETANQEILTQAASLFVQIDDSTERDQLVLTNISNNICYF